VGDGRDGGSRERHDEVLPLRECGRWRVAEDEVAEDPAAERCDHRQDRDPDDVEVAADGHQRTRDSEGEQADEVEFGLHRDSTPPCASVGERPRRCAGEDVRPHGFALS
jgi:hypothetical protein